MKVLIVGLGSIARKHIAALRRICPQADILALRSSAGSPGVEGVTDITGYDEIPSDIDFAIISNPTSAHATTALKLASLHKPLFIEKPVFDSMEHAHIADMLEAEAIPTYVGCNLRFLGCVRFLKDLMTQLPSDSVNEVNVYCGSYLPDWRPGSDYRQCYSARPELGGGVNIDLIHDIDNICHIFGMPQSHRGVARSASTLDIAAVDYANFLLTYPGFCASVILNYYRRDYRRTIEVVMSDRTITADLAANTVSDSKGNVLFAGRDTIADTYDTQMRFFLEAIATGRHIGNNARQAVDILKICLDYERLS